MSYRYTTFLSPIVFVLASAGPARAADTQPCSTIQWQPNRVYVLKARLHHAVHVILPEPVSGKPVNGNPDLWVVDGQGTHLFIKPTNADEAEGGSTSVTVVGQSNASFDFRVERVTKDADNCVYIQRGALLSAETDWRTAEEKRLAQMQRQLETLQQQLADSGKAADQRALDALSEYRGKVFTTYKWGKGKGFLGKNVIQDVWDDGRFTYIRVASDNKGLMQVTASIDGKNQLIEYDYDSTHKLYTLAGLYPELTLRYDNESTITIARTDEREG